MVELILAFIKALIDAVLLALRRDFAGAIKMFVAAVTALIAGLKTAQKVAP